MSRIALWHFHLHNQTSGVIAWYKPELILRLLIYTSSNLILIWKGIRDQQPKKGGSMSSFVEKHNNTVAQLYTMSMAFLPLIRYFYLALVVPESHGWRHGIDFTTGKWGHERGLTIAYAVQKFVYDLLRCRQSTSDFYDPVDIDIRKKISPDEKTVLNLLIFMRMDETKKVRNIIFKLHRGRIDPIFVRHGLELAAMLDGAPMMVKIPKLKVVK